MGAEYQAFLGKRGKMEAKKGAEGDAWDVCAQETVQQLFSHSNGFY